jgi:hypothetical protein
MTDSLARNKTNQVRGEYVVPKNAEHEPIYQTLKAMRVLERMSELLSPLRLPRRLTLKLVGCDGDANAYYEDQVVTICYEYLDYVVKLAPKDGAPVAAALGITNKIALVGPTVDVFLHEVGHAVFDMLGIPLFGREEDAADQFSAYLMLQFAKEDARKLILGASFLGAKDALEAQKQDAKLKDFADEHGFPAQRYFNLLCMAYGSDPKAFAGAVTTGQLPAERAEGCEAEYRQVQKAFERLIRPYVSRSLARKVRQKRWLDFDTPVPGNVVRRK